MTVNEIVTSPQLIKRFCRDYNVPVSTYAFPYFEQQLETLSIHNKGWYDAFTQFIKEVSPYSTAEDYFDHYNEVKESIISYISSHPQFISFSNSTFSKGVYHGKELYSDCNNGKVFISVDLRKANFNIVKMHCPDMFSKDTWEQVVEEFGGSPYLQNSKYIRQVIFGACNPKKQIQAQTEYMNKIAKYLEDSGYNIYSVAVDEIILDSDEFYRAVDVLNAIGVPSEIVHLEKFLLTKLNGGYVKSIINSTDEESIGVPKFKCVDGDFYCQFVKYYYHKPIEDSDLIFDYKGTIAKFINPMINPLYALHEVDSPVGSLHASDNEHTKNAE